MVDGLLALINLSETRPAIGGYWERWRTHLRRFRRLVRDTVRKVKEMTWPNLRPILTDDLQKRRPSATSRKPSRGWHTKRTILMGVEEMVIQGQARRSWFLVRHLALVRCCASRSSLTYAHSAHNTVTSHTMIPWARQPLT